MEEKALCDLFTVAACSDIRDILRPFLQRFRLNYFNHTRIYNSMEKFHLSTCPEWVEHFIRQKYYNIGKLARHPSCYNSCWVLWDSWDFNCISYKIVGKDAEDNFNLGRGLSIIKKMQNYVEFFDFTTAPKNYWINNVYLNNIDIFTKFLSFYQVQAAKLIKQAEQNRYLIMPDINIYSEYPDALPLAVSNSEYKKTQNLTSREWECLLWLKRGKTAPDIAMLLNISTRTIEKHIAHLKQKLDCYTMFQLGHVMAQLGG